VYWPTEDADTYAAAEETANAGAGTATATIITIVPQFVIMRHLL
jgi:hypothetical protein